MTTINLRGTGGSGKSTVVRRVMALYKAKIPYDAFARKRPMGYQLGHEGSGIVSLFVPGHYETACGGCDTIKTVDEVYKMVNSAVDEGLDVLYEGIMVQDDVRRAVELDKRLRANGSQLIVIGLITPLVDCLAAIRARREERGDTKPLNPKNTTGRFNSQKNIQARLKDAGVTVERLDREAAFLRCCALLRLDPGPSSGV